MYADPNSKAASGDLLALVTGGRLSSPASSGDQKDNGGRKHDRDRKHDRHNDRNHHRDHNHDHGRSNPPVPYGGYNQPAPHGGYNASPYPQRCYTCEEAYFEGRPPRFHDCPLQYANSRDFDGGPRGPRDGYDPYRGYDQGDGQNNQQEEEKKPADFSSPASMAKRLIKQNVLYLMIVNMPSEEEMAEAKRAMGNGAQVTESQL